MLTPEELDIVGLQPQSRFAGKSSRVSQALRAIRDDLETTPANRDVVALGGAAEFRLMVASDRAARERAYSLAQQVYLECGYASPTASDMLVTQHDADPETFTLLAEDLDGCAAGTVTLLFNNLPCQELYTDEIAALHRQGRFLVEVTRLAIAQDFRRSKELLVRMMNFICIYARHVRGYTDFVIEVNPRHVDFYRRLLGFEIIGEQRACTRVNGAPAVFLRMDLDVFARGVVRVGGKGAAANERTLYPYFLPLNEESAVAGFLARNHRPMSAADALYFGLTPATPSGFRECVTTGKSSLESFRHVHDIVAG